MMITGSPNEKPDNKPQHKLSLFMTIVVCFIILGSGFELYRVIQYVQNWQFLLTIIDPIQLWLLANLAFFLFAVSIPIFAGLVTRSSWAHVWSIRYLAFSTLVGISRTVLFSKDPFAPIHWLSLGLQVLVLITLVVVLFVNGARKVMYADKQ
jgi:hypothetical protein